MEQGYIKFTNDKQARWIKVRSPLDENNRKQAVQKTIREILTKWDLYQPKLIISVTGGAGTFNVPKELEDALKKDLCKVLLITNAWIISGGTNVGVMKLVGEVIASQSSSQQKDKELVVLGVVTWGITGNRKGLESNKVFNYPDTLEEEYNENENNKALLNSDHTHFIFVDEGKGNQFGQEIAFRNEFESQLSKINLKDATIPSLLLVINGGPNTLLTVKKSMESNTPVLVFEQTKGCADLIANLIKLAEDPEMFDDDDEFDESNSDKLLDLINDSNILDEFKNRDAQTKETKKQEAIDRTKLILNIYQKNKSLLNVFNIDDTENPDKISLESQILKIFFNTQTDHQKIFMLAQEWNRDAKDILRSVISDYRPELINRPESEDSSELDKTPEFVAYLLQTVKLEDVFDKNTVLGLYDGHDFFQLMTATNTSWNNQYSDIKKLLKKLLPSHIKETVIPDDEEKFKHVATNLFYWALLHNYIEMAKVFWIYTEHPLANALIGSNIVKLIVDYVPKLKYTYKRKGYLLDFEDLAIDLITNFGKKTAKIKANYHGLSSLSLLENIEFYGNQSPLSIAYFCKCHKFYSNINVKKTLASIWLNGQTRGEDGLIEKLLKDTANFISIGFTAPKLSFNKDIDLQKKQLKRHEKQYIEDGKDNFRNKFLQIESERLISQYESDETDENYISKYKKYWQAPKTKFINSFVSFCLFLALFTYLIASHMKNFCTHEIVDIYYRKWVFLEVLLDIWVFSYIVEEFIQLFSYDLFMKAHLTFAWRINNSLNENNESSFKEFCRKFKNSLYYYFTDPRNYFDILAIGLYITVIIFKYFLYGLFKKETLVFLIKILLYADLFFWYLILLNYFVLIFKISLTVERNDLNKTWDFFPYRFVLTHATYPVLPLPLNLIFDPIYSIYRSISYTKKENERKNPRKEVEITVLEEKCAKNAYKTLNDKRLEEKIKSMTEYVSEEDVNAPDYDKRLINEINDRSKSVQNYLKEYVKQ